MSGSGHRRRWRRPKNCVRGVKLWQEQTCRVGRVGSLAHVFEKWRFIMRIDTIGVGYHKYKVESGQQQHNVLRSVPATDGSHSVICRTSSAIQFATCAVAFTLLAAMNWKAVHNPPIFSSSKASLCDRPATMLLPSSSTVANVDMELLHPPDRLGS